jgi:hypothetical protein
VPHPAHIDMNKIGNRIDPDPTIVQRQGGPLQGRQAASRDADVRCFGLDVHAVFCHTCGVFP